MNKKNNKLDYKNKKNNNKPQQKELALNNKLVWDKSKEKRNLSNNVYEL